MLLPVNARALDVLLPLAAQPAAANATRRLFNREEVLGAPAPGTTRAVYVTGLGARTAPSVGLPAAFQLFNASWSGNAPQSGVDNVTASLCADALRRTALAAQAALAAASVNGTVPSNASALLVLHVSVCVIARGAGNHTLGRALRAGEGDGLRARRLQQPAAAASPIPLTPAQIALAFNATSALDLLVAEALSNGTFRDSLSAQLHLAATCGGTASPYWSPLPQAMGLQLLASDAAVEQPGADATAAATPAGTTVAASSQLPPWGAGLLALGACVVVSIAAVAGWRACCPKRGGKPWCPRGFGRRTPAKAASKAMRRNWDDPEFKGSSRALTIIADNPAAVRRPSLGAATGGGGGGSARGSVFIGSLPVAAVATGTPNAATSSGTSMAPARASVYSAPSTLNPATAAATAGAGSAATTGVSPQLARALQHYGSQKSRRLSSAAIKSAGAQAGAVLVSVSSAPTGRAAARASLVALPAQPVGTRR